MNNELVESTKHKKIYHIWSADRINEILSHEGEEASNCIKKYYKFQLCAKVDYVIGDDGDKIKSGYVMHETNLHIQVLTMNETFISFQKPKYNKLRMTTDKGYNKIAYNLNDEDLVVNVVEDENCSNNNRNRYNQVDRKPSVYVGTSLALNEAKLVWVYPIRVVILERAQLNLRIYSDYIAWIYLHKNLKCILRL